MKIAFLLIAIAIYSIRTSAQPAVIPSDHLEVTFNKTTVLIFPANIKKVDIGNPDVTARTVKIDEVEKILRVKAAKENAATSSLHVFTDDGRVYSFTVSYSANPPYETRDLSKEKPDAIPYILSATGTMNAATVRDFAEFISNLRPTVARPRTSNNLVQMYMRGIYYHNGVVFFHFKISNLSDLPYNIDFTRFYIKDQKTSKRTSIMEKEIQPLYIYYAKGTRVEGWDKESVVVAFDQFTISQKKLFMMELFEKNGDRHLQCPVKGWHILKARPLLIEKPDINIVPPAPEGK
jgi:conjugative transposon TraN protein